MGAVSFGSAAYVSRYSLKKVHGVAARSHYTRLIPETGELVSLTPEFVTMSLRPAIGREWFNRFYDDVFPSDQAVLPGQGVFPVPKYFDKLMKDFNPDEFEQIKLDRIKRGQVWRVHSTPDRLAVRERVARARLGVFLIGSFEYETRNFFCI